MPLHREEYVEQAYFFRTLRERMQQSMSTQELLEAIKQEISPTTHLPYGRWTSWPSELRLTGGFATAMAKLPHYFTPSRPLSWRRREGRGASSISAWDWKSCSARPSIAPDRRHLKACSSSVRNHLPQPPRL